MGVKYTATNFVSKCSDRLGDWAEMEKSVCRTKGGGFISPLKRTNTLGGLFTFLDLPGTPAIIIQRAKHQKTKGLILRD